MRLALGAFSRVPMRPLFWCLALAAALQLSPPLSDIIIASNSGYATIDELTIGQGEMILYGLEDTSFSERMPLYPVLISLLDRHAPAWLAPSAGWLLWLMPLALVLALGRILHSWGCGLLAALLSIPLVGVMIPAQNDMHLFSIGFLLTAAVLAWRADAPSAQSGLVAGLAIGLSLLCRSTLFLFPAVLCAYEWAAGGPGTARRRWKGWALLALTSYLALAPWVRANRRLNGAAFPLEGQRSDAIVIAGSMGFVKSVEVDPRDLAGPPLGKSALPWAAREVSLHPARYLMACARRVVFVASLHPVLFLLGAAGVWLGRRREGCRQTALLAGYLLGMHCMMAIDERYMRPLWPLLSVLAASAILRVIDPWTSGPSGRPPMALVWACLAPMLGLGLYTAAEVWSYPRRVRAGSLAGALQAHPESAWLWAQSGRRRLKEGDARGAAQDLSRSLCLAHQRKITIDYALALLARGGKRPPVIEPLGFDWSTEELIRWDVLRTMSFLQRGRFAAAAAALEECERRVGAPILKSSDQWISMRGPRVNATALQDKLILGHFSSELSALPLRQKAAWLMKLNRLLRVPQETWIELAAELAGNDDPQTALRTLSLVDARSPASAELRKTLAGSGRREPPVAAPRPANAFPEGGRDARPPASTAPRPAKGDRPAVAKAPERTALGPTADGGSPEKTVDRFQDRLRAARTMLKGGDTAAAKDAATKAMAAAREPSESLELARLCGELKEGGCALAEARNLVQRGGLSCAQWLEVSRVADEMGDRDLALRALERGEAARPSEPELRLLAMRYQGLRENERARRILDGLTREYPSKSLYRSDRGVLRWLSGDAEGAIEDLREARRLAPASPEATLSLASVLESAGKPEEALRVCEEALAGAASAPPGVWKLVDEARARLAKDKKAR